MDFDNKAANMAWMHIHKNEAMIGGSIAQPKDTLGPYVAAYALTCCDRSFEMSYRDLSRLVCHHNYSA